ncbi:MAG: histidine kinase [Deltaproteobacteria bacterium]|nr:histidine kinase [Deltaproteobacteria bacterium]
MWTLTTQMALVAVIVCVASIVALLLRSRRRLYIRFAFFASSLGAYYLTALLSAVIDGPQWDSAETTSAFLASARIVTGAGVVLTTSVFFDAILGEAGIIAAQRRRKTVLGALVMAVIGVTPLAAVPGVQGLAVASALLLLGARARAVLTRANDVESRAERTRLRYLAFGGALSLIGFLCDVGAVMGWPVPPIGGLVVALYVYFISQALLLSRLLDLHELLGRGLVFGTLALILASVYGVMVAWAGERRGLFLFNTLVASGLILILFDPLRTYLEETTTRLFFREHVDFARSLRSTAQSLTTTIELDDAVNLALDSIYDAKRATHTSVYFLDVSTMRFSLKENRGPRPIRALEALSHPAFFSELLRNESPLLRESVERRLDDNRHQKAFPARSDEHSESHTEGAVFEDKDEAMLAGLDDLFADLVVPIRTESNVIGVLCLRDERLSEAFASDEIAALMRVGEQLAVNFENSRMFSLARERDRLATLGEMSAGLAHEIRNPLAAIKGAAQELDPEKFDGFDKEFLEIIVSEVNRLNVVVSEFLNYARPFRGTFVPIAPNDAVKRTVQLMVHDLPDVEVDFDLGDDLPDISGDAEQLQQVLINLVLNAADAMERKGRIVIYTSSQEAIERDGPARGLLEAPPMVEIRVRDFGPGIPPQVKDSLFIPFFTTKQKGTGLGLPLCQRIVQHHGGTLEVHSTPGQGATFMICLPSVPCSKVPNDDEALEANSGEKSEIAVT